MADKAIQNMDDTRVGVRLRVCGLSAMSSGSSTPLLLTTSRVVLTGSLYLWRINPIKEDHCDEGQGPGLSEGEGMVRAWVRARVRVRATIRP